MQYEASTPQDYINQLENDWRKERLLYVRELILAHGKQLEEGIAYKMLAYRYKNKIVFNLNAQRAYVSLYVGTINKVENAQALLRDFSIGKGCIRIKKNVDIDQTGLEAFIKRTIAIWEKGGDTDC